MASRKTLDSPDGYSIGWIAALDIEFAAATAMLDEEHDQPSGFARHETDKNAYAWGQMGSHAVVIACLPAGRYGTTSAATTASSLLASLPHIKIGLLVGIGGGIARSHDIRLGDVVVSQPDGTSGGVCQHDLFKAKAGDNRERKGFLAPPPTFLLGAVTKMKGYHRRRGSRIPDLMRVMLEENPGMAEGTEEEPAFIYQGSENDRLFRAEYNHVGGADCRDCAATQEIQRDTRRSPVPKIHYGIIASGNTLVKDATTRDRIVADVGEGCLCIEMEAAGLMDHFPCLVIRGICDYADSHKNDRWQPYAAATAAAYAKEFLTQVPPAEVQKSKRALEILQSVQEVVQATQHSVESLASDAQFKKIKNWLKPPDPSTNYHDAARKRHAGTGVWLLESNVFREWESHVDGRLLLLGLSGCGKTILMSTILEHLSSKNPSAIILNFFFDFRDNYKRTVDQLLRALAFQLYTKCDTSRAIIDAVFERGEKQPSTGELSGFLKKMMQTTKTRIFIVLDALDECGVQDELITWLEDYSNHALPNASFIATSRPEVKFQNMLAGWQEQNIASDTAESIIHDISLFVKARLHSKSFERWSSSPNVLRRIQTIVTEKAGLMFRLAACQLDLLADCQDYDEIEEKLNTLPDTLDKIYYEILESIPEGRRRETTIRLLQFLCYSKRPIRLEEAVDAMATKIDDAFDPDKRMPRPAELRTSCASLINLETRVLKEKPVEELQLAHLSVREYLTSDKVHKKFRESLSCTNANGSITRTCLAYLSSITFYHSTKRTERVFPLAQYAIRYWLHHARSAESLPDVRDGIWKFFDDQDAYTNWGRIFHPGRPRDYSPKEPLPQLYVAVLGGLEIMVGILVENGADVNAQGGHHRNPLCAACRLGYERIVEVLVEKGADVKARNEYKNTVLQIACKRGHERIVRILLEKGGDVGTRDINTALYMSCRKGYEEVVKILVEKGANVNTRDRVGNTVLHIACKEGYKGVVKILVKNGADINKRNRYNESALYTACELGYERIVRILLEKGVDVNARYGSRETLLYVACRGGYEGIVRILLEKGANINVRYLDGEAPLYTACAQGHKGIVRILVEKGADVNVRDKYGETPLHVACEEGYKRLVKFLVEKGANVNLRNKDGQTPLCTACEIGYERIVRILLEKGADVNARNVYGETPLKVACWGGHEGIVRILTENGGARPTRRRRV